MAFTPSWTERWNCESCIFFNQIWSSQNKWANWEQWFPENDGVTERELRLRNHCVQAKNERIWEKREMNILVGEMHRQDMRKRYRANILSLRGPLSQHLYMFTNPETLQTWSFWVFLAASLHSHDCLNHWPLAINWTSRPYQLPWSSGVELNLSKFGWVPWTSAPVFRWAPKWPHWNN